MAQLFKNLLDKTTVDTLLDYFNLTDHRTDKRPDVVSKHPRWGIDVWPQHIVEKILISVLPKTYTVDEVIFNQSKISFKLHVDSGRANQPVFKAVLIPLEVRSVGATAFFDNYWLGPSTKFSKTQFNPLSYTLIGLDGSKIFVENLKTLITQLENSVVDNLPNDSEFLIELQKLVNIRTENQGLSPTDLRTSDYTNIINYQSSLQFNKNVWKSYLSHIDYQDLEGLSLEQIITWNVGDVIVFDRRQLHCATAGHSSKIGLTVFTNQI